MTTKTMPIETVIFDLGGTLIEYAGPYRHWPELETPGFRAAFDRLSRSGNHLPSFDAFREAGFALLPRRWQQATAGERNLTLVDLLAEALDQCGARRQPAAALTAAAAAYGAAIQAQAWLMDGALETVAAVKAQGWRLGLVSNTMFAGAIHRADLARFGLLAYFDALLFSADEDKWKPNAAPFQHVLRELAADPRTAVYVGDDPASDVVGGQAAGLRAISFHANQRFATPAGVRPDAEISHLSELLPLLTQWNHLATS